MATVTKANTPQASAANNTEKSTASSHWLSLKNRAQQTSEPLQQALSYSSENNHAAFTESLNSYAQMWQEIANEAYGYGLHGLCDVCMLYHTTALDINQLEQGMDDEHGLLLEQWEDLFIAYLDDPGKDNTRAALVKFLQDPIWTEPLPNEESETIKSLLMPEPIAFGVEAEEDNGADFEVAEPITTDSNTDQSGHAEHWVALKEHTLQTSEPLHQALKHSHESNDAGFSESFASYAGLWLQIANEAYGYGLHGLCDVCMLFQSTALELDQMEQGLDDEHGLLLEQWEVLFIAYLDAPDLEKPRHDLVKFLQDPLWTEPLPNEDLEMVQSLLLPEPIDFGVEADGDESGADLDADFDADFEFEEAGSAAGDSTDQSGHAAHWAALKSHTLLTSEPLHQALKHSQESNDAAFSESFASYAGMWLQIANEAYGYGLHGLCDVCMLFQSTALELDQMEQGLDDEHGLLLEQWEVLFIAYLDAPDLEKPRHDLVKFLQDPLWTEPLPSEDLEMVQSLLLPEPIDFGVEAETEELSTDFDADFGFEVETEELSTDFDSDFDFTAETAAEPDSEVIAAHAEHWAVLKTHTLRTTEPLHQALNFSQDNNQAALNESFGNYAKMWQQIASEAYSYGLHGLCDVCMLFHASALNNDLIEQGIQEEHGLLLEQWEDLFTAYLDNPGQDNTRNALVKFLQEPLWAEPLPTDDVQMVHKLLIPEPITFGVEGDESVEELLNIDVQSEPVEVKTVAPDVVNLIRSEFESYAESMLVALSSEHAKTMEPAKFNAALRHQTDALEMLAKISETVDLGGLKKVFDTLAVNMEGLFSGDEQLDDAHAQLLKTALTHILHYLATVGDVTIYTTLAQHFADPAWPAPLSVAEEQGLIGLFKQVKLLTAEEARGPKKIASPEDVSLLVPEDVNQELLESLYNELPILTADFTETIQQLLRNGDLADVEKAQRLAHTLKGSGNLVGVKGIASLTHSIEEILEKVAEHGSMPRGVFDVLLMDSADCLEAISDNLLGQGSAPDNTLVLLQELLDWAYFIDAEGVPASIEAAPSFTPATVVETSISATVTAAATAEAQPQSENEVFETRGQERTGATETMTRIPSSLVEDMLRMAGENTILTGQIQQRLLETIEQSHTVRDQNTAFLDLIAELEHLVEVQGVASQERLTVTNDDFDPLEMDQYNELHTCSHRLLEVATDARVITDAVNTQLGDLKDLLVVQERLQHDNHELVLQTRMVPVQSVVPRFHRAIRQASRVTKKKVKLHIVGSETLIDREILNDLIDALMHMLRNSVDHGIEGSEQRIAIGKTETGNITLEFARRGNHIIVICQDDGSGLDLVRIRATAEKKNMISPEQVVSDHEIRRMILNPNFSTRDSATQVSGRGIGMDAVNVQVLKMKGEVTIDSQFGQGCRIELALPATLSSVRALLVRSGNELLAISSRSLEQVLYPGAGKLQMIGNELAFQQEDKLYSADKFESLLHISSTGSEVLDSSLSALLFKTADASIKAIMVEQVVDSRELVVKNMGQYIPEIPGIAGATILGDGSVTPVLDVPDLLRSSGRGRVVTQQRSDSGQSNQDRILPNALVIDDSLSARRSAAQLLSDMGYEVSTAIDGVDAIDRVDEKIPDIILVDMEMPRMNGLEFTAHVRNRPDTKHLPVIMITSRATEKHRQLAKSTGVDVYLNKPFSEDELMGHIARLMGAS